jgi:hypothetical protein
MAASRRVRACTFSNSSSDDRAGDLPDPDEFKIPSDETLESLGRSALLWMIAERVRLWARS